MFVAMVGIASYLLSYLGIQNTVWLGILGKIHDFNKHQLDPSYAGILDTINSTEAIGPLSSCNRSCGRGQCEVLGYW